VVDIVIIAEDVEAWGAGNWEGYNRIVENDIQEIISKENVQYSEKIFPRKSNAELEELDFNEKLFYENFPNHYSNVEANVIYRLSYIKNNNSYVVYGMISGLYPSRYTKLSNFL